jgi:hypothetical protein
MQKTNFIFLLILTLFLSGCWWSSTTEYTGIRFPETTISRIAFQENAVSRNCSAFAHLLMNSKMNSSGQDIASSMQLEAQNKGANLVLIGMAREMEDEELEGNRFDYYGPEYAYNFNKTWLGWKFGFDEWNDAGNLIGIGADSWGKTEAIFKNSLLIQAVFLRCADSN